MKVEACALRKQMAAGQPGMEDDDHSCWCLQNGVQYLDLGNMELAGSIPGCLLGSPGKLSIIGLSNNNLTGSIPDNIPSSSSLFNFDTSTNDLTGSIPASFVNARDLYMLNLHSNQLDGPTPDDLGIDMPLLYAVQLYDNALTGELSLHMHTSRQECHWSVLNVFSRSNSYNCSIKTVLPCCANCFGVF